MDTIQAIKSRKTIKVLSDTEWGISKSEDQINILLEELMELALKAPFHYFSDPIHRKSKPLDSLLPWRCYSLDTKGCRDLAHVMSINKVEAGKILQMLHTADALVLVTWLPDAPEQALKEGELFTASLKNMEHLAAASSAVQNILLGATSKEIPNYWSSGGVLRENSFFEYLGIPSTEILLGALFLFPIDVKDAEIKYGANRADAGGIDQFWKKVKVE